jgi:hypothetical protein
VVSRAKAVSRAGAAAQRATRSHSTRDAVYMMLVVFLGLFWGTHGAVERESDLFELSMICQSRSSTTLLCTHQCCLAYLDPLTANRNQHSTWKLTLFNLTSL